MLNNIIIKLVQIIHLLQVTDFIWLNKIVDYKTYLLLIMFDKLCTMILWIIFNNRCILTIIEQYLKGGGKRANDMNINNCFVYRLFKMFGIELKITRKLYNKILWIISYVIFVIFFIIYFNKY
jgi:hypothetical protein